MEFPYRSIVRRKGVSDCRRTRAVLTSEMRDLPAIVAGEGLTGENQALGTTWGCFTETERKRQTDSPSAFHTIG